MNRRDFVRASLAGLATTACSDLVSPRTTARPPAPSVIRSGPWKGVYDTPDPFDASPDRLRDLLNGYIPDPENGSGVYARAGFTVGNNGVQIDSAATYTAGATWDCTVYAHTQLDGSVLVFAAANGKIYRLTNPFASTTGATTAVDVTPVGITISTAVGATGFGGFASLDGDLIVNDGQNRPWIGTNLTNTPITGTYIDYDSLGSAWTAHGPPVVYLGAVFFILKAVNGVSRREDISWSEPGQPATGYQQTNFDNNWTLTKHATGPIYALAATNLALYYFRADSIGAVSGSTTANLASTATNDAISAEIGTVRPQSIAQYGTTIYFTDAQSRPYRLVTGAQPEPIWKQMRSQVDALMSVYTTSPGVTLVGAIEPGYGYYLLVDLTRNPDTLYVFDARSGTYLGRWTINDSGTGGINISSIATVAHPTNNVDGFIVAGEAVRGDGKSSYLWFLQNQRWPFTNVDGSTSWLDGNEFANTFIQPKVNVETDRLGESEDVVYLVDRVTLITGNAAPCSVTIETPNTAGTVIGTPTPEPSSDATYRLTVGADGIQGRGPGVTVAPVFTAATSSGLGQWSLHRLNLSVSVSRAVGDEP